MTYRQKYVLKKTKDINVKVFNMITNKNEAKTMTKHISCDFKCKFNSTTKQKWNNETFQCACKNYRTCTIDYSWNPSTCICQNRKYQKSVVDDSVIAYIVSTKMKNTIVTSTVSRNSDGKSVRCKIDCYILHTVLLVIILLLIITIFSYHYAKHSSKQKSIYIYIKWKIMNL